MKFTFCICFGFFCFSGLNAFMLSLFSWHNQKTTLTLTSKYITYLEYIAYFTSEIESKLSLTNAVVVLAIT